MNLLEIRKSVDSKLYDLSLSKDYYNNEKDSLTKEQDNFKAILDILRTLSVDEVQFNYFADELHNCYCNYVSMIKRQEEVNFNEVL